MLTFIRDKGSVRVWGTHHTFPHIASLYPMHQSLLSTEGRGCGTWGRAKTGNVQMEGLERVAKSPLTTRLGVKFDVDSSHCWPLKLYRTITTQGNKWYQLPCEMNPKPNCAVIRLHSA